MTTTTRIADRVAARVARAQASVRAVTERHASRAEDGTAAAATRTNAKLGLARQYAPKIAKALAADANAAVDAMTRDGALAAFMKRWENKLR